MDRTLRRVTDQIVSDRRIDIMLHQVEILLIKTKALKENNEI